MLVYHAYLGTLLARRRLDSGIVEAAATAPCVNVDDSAAHQYNIFVAFAAKSNSERNSPPLVRRDVLAERWRRDCADQFGLQGRHSGQSVDALFPKNGWVRGLSIRARFHSLHIFVSDQVCLRTVVQGNLCAP